MMFPPLSGCISFKANGERIRVSLMASSARSCPFPITASPSHQPEHISVTDRELTYSPRTDTPQFSTKSICTTPGFSLSSSAAVLVGTLVHSREFLLLTYFRFPLSTSFSCFNLASMVEGTISLSLRAVSSEQINSFKVRSRSVSSQRIGASLWPQGKSNIFQMHTSAAFTGPSLVSFRGFLLSPPPFFFTPTFCRNFLITYFLSCPVLRQYSSS